MEIVALFFLELFFLFILSRTLQKRLSQFLYTLTRNIKWSVYFMAIIFLPGTLLHEIAHYLMAHILFVPAGHIELMPKLEGNSVKLGSVLIGKTDPFRRLLIGIAPFLTGTTVILFVLTLTQQQNLWTNIWVSIGILYILFEVGNTMFSSKKDLEGAIFVIIFVISLSLVSFLFGLRVSIEDLTTFLTPQRVHLFYQGVIFLLFPLALDIILIFLFTLSVKFLKKT